MADYFYSLEMLIRAEYKVCYTAGCGICGDLFDDLAALAGENNQ